MSQEAAKAFVECLVRGCTIKQGLDKKYLMAEYTLALKRYDATTLETVWTRNKEDWLGKHWPEMKIIRGKCDSFNNASARTGATFDCTTEKLGEKPMNVRYRWSGAEWWPIDKQSGDWLPVDGKFPQ